jgi:predicted amidohydrolase
VCNTHVLVGSDGTILSSYDKIHLFDVAIPNGPTLRESDFTRAGTRLEVTQTADVGRIGLSVCYDLRFAEMYAAMARMQAQLIMIPAAFTLKTGMAHWEVLLRARAIETQCYVLAAAQSGQHNTHVEKKAANAYRESYGHAMIISPWGDVIAQVSSTTDVGLCYADVCLDAIDKIRTAVPIQTHQRLDVYRAAAPKKDAAAKTTTTE